MYWQEDPEPLVDQTPDDVVDVLFTLDCRSLPVDHAHALSTALIECAPWLHGEPGCGLHTIHVAGSQNGWERPAADGGQPLLLSKRTKLEVRVPAARVAALCAALEGQRLQVADCPLAIGTGKPRRLTPATTLLARHVAAPLDQPMPAPVFAPVSAPVSAPESTGANPGSNRAGPAPASASAPLADEDAFLSWVAAELGHLGIRVRKALCGKVTTLGTPDGPLITRSLLLADLKPDESLRLQQHGLGPGRAMGCGIFIPHKGIEAVGAERA